MSAYHSFSWGPMKMAAMSGLTLTSPDGAPQIPQKNKSTSSSSAPPTDERIRELEGKVNGGQVKQEAKMEFGRDYDL